VGLPQALRSRRPGAGLESACAGEIFGLIPRPDGAGKTSTFHILAGVIEPSDGQGAVLGRPPHEARERIGT